MKDKFKKQLQELYTKLSGNDSLQIQSFFMPPPASSEQIKKYKLSGDMLDFYSEMNGTQISYVIEGNDMFDKQSFGSYNTAFPWMWPREHYWHLDGCINILPVEIMMESDWKDYIWFDSKKKYYVEYKGEEILQTEFEKKLKPLDIFSKSSIAVVNFTKDACDILLSTDHNASYTDFNPTSFEEYIQGIIRTEGLIEKRKNIFL